ncbi:MAG: selenite/tellurite reduction operon c-type cytochrome lipoprotein ExtS [Thermodesulfobacteriota bacterium]|nr:selenite/tellurite reduction operon c-type cytochrome lipoprotein ExtS [Thermodesulfobacteriota bacterium]
MVVWLVFLISVLGGAGSALAQDLNSCLACHQHCHGEVVWQRDSVVPLVCTQCHRGNNRTTRKTISHHFLIDAAHAWYRLPLSRVYLDGKKRIDQLSCRRCHLQNKQGNTLAINLDQLLATASVDEIETALRVSALYMPNFSISQGDLIALVTQVLAGGLAAPPVSGSAPVVVHFEDNIKSEHLFVKHCGVCHRVLTHHQGGLGHGLIGPNLSGLFTPFYPATAKDGQHWTREAVVVWLKNPRKIRPLTRMPPVTLINDEALMLVDATWPPLDALMVE